MQVTVKHWQGPHCTVLGRERTSGRHDDTRILLAHASRRFGREGRDFRIAQEVPQKSIFGVYAKGVGTWNGETIHLHVEENDR